MNQPLVSVVVPTKNSSIFLEACLKSIKEQTYPHIELIVVDNFSTDGTQELARKYTDKVFEKGPERSAQVNFGVDQASGEYVYKVDSDFVLDPEVVSECVAKAQEGFDAVVVHNSPDVRVSWIAKIRKFEVDMYKYDITHSSARFVRKEIYKKIGGFNPLITAGEDYDFQNKLNRINVKTVFIDAEALHLGEPTSFWKHMMKYYEYGKDFVHYKNENLKEAEEQLRFGRSVYLKNWRKFAQHPMLGFCFFIYSMCKFTGGGIGFCVGNGINRNKTKGKSNDDVTRIILSPHYDDAVFSLGGMIASNPKNCTVVTVFAGVPNNSIESWWDKKCGFKDSTEAMRTRGFENKKSLIALGLTESQIVDLDVLEKQYRLDNIERTKIVSLTTKLIYKSSCAYLLSKDVEIYAPLNTMNEDHYIVQEVALRLGQLCNTDYVSLYEDMPYHIRPSAIQHRKKTIQSLLKKSDYKNFVFSHKVWMIKKTALQKYNSQFVGAAKYIETVIYIFGKFCALLIGKPFSFVERVRLVHAGASEKLSQVMSKSTA